jgi:hypothetical protein
MQTRLIKSIRPPVENQNTHQMLWFCHSCEWLAMWVLYGASPRLWTASGGVLTSRPAFRLTGAALFAALGEV